MAWYYVEKGDRKGPVEQEVFDEYVEAGRILSTTRVWKEGMAQWEPYGQLEGASSDVRELCSLCKQPRTSSDLLHFELHRVCPECKPLFVQRLKEGTLPATGTQYGGFWARFVAYTIDTMVIIIPMAILVILFTMLLLPLLATNAPMAALPLYFFILVLQHGVPAVYEIIMVKQYGATLGKMVFNLQVVDANGKTPGWGRSTGRHFAKYLNQFTCNLSLVIVAFDAEKRGLQDHLCHTRVVRS